MSRVVHFEIPADNPDRTISFYSRTFGWKIEKWSGPTAYWLVMTGEHEDPGIDGGIIKRSPPLVGVVNSIGVTSVDEFTGKVKANGGKVVVPKQAVPGVGYMAYCQDTEGNFFGLFQPDTSA